MLQSVIILILCLRQFGSTPIAEASKWDNSDIIRLLIDRGADLNTHELNPDGVSSDVHIHSTLTHK